MSRLKISTARSKVVFMTDSTDHVTGKTGLTLTITASKDGGAFASISPTVTELATGWYKLALTTSHTDTAGDLALHITATGADPTDVVWEVESLDQYTASVVQTGDSFARLGAPAGASVSADVAAVKAQTAAIETDTQDIQTRLPAALVSGRMDSSTGAMAANVLTAAATAADFTTEVTSGLAQEATLTTIAGYLDTEIAAILEDTGTTLPATLATLATQASVNTIDDFLDTEVAAVLAAVDTEVAAIKAKTDGLTYTVANVLDANIQRINDVTITGDGQVGTEFGV